MKTFALSCFACLLFIVVKADGPYRRYLLAEVYQIGPKHEVIRSEPAPVKITPLPRYRIPQGNIFCRMEDKLMKATKVWITVGVK